MEVALLVSPAEPRRLRDLGHTSPAPEEYGCDFLIVGAPGIIGVQRKQFPGDFMSSVTDGRLHTVTMRIRATTFPIVLLEGTPAWTTSGELLESYGGSLKRSTLRAMEFSLAQAGITVMWTDSIADTCEYIAALMAWWSKDEHAGFTARPGPGRTNEFGKPIGERDWGVHLLQGFDGVGPKLAGRIFDEFGRVPLRWDVPTGRLAAVHGLGPHRLEALTRMVAPMTEGGEA